MVSAAPSGLSPCLSTSFADLAVAAGVAEGTVRRRVNHLRPAEPVPAARTLAAQPQVAFVAATTGPANLLAQVLCRDVDALYGYLAEDVGAVSAVDRIETAPVIRTLKRAAS